MDLRLYINGVGHAIQATMKIAGLTFETKVDEPDTLVLSKVTRTRERCKKNKAEEVARANELRHRESDVAAISAKIQHALDLAEVGDETDWEELRLLYAVKRNHLAEIKALRVVHIHVVWVDVVTRRDIRLKLGAPAQTPYGLLIYAPAAVPMNAEPAEQGEEHKAAAIERLYTDADIGVFDGHVWTSDASNILPKICRAGHTLTYFDGKIYIIGGRDTNSGRPCDTILVVDMPAMTIVKKIPCPYIHVEYHSAALYNGKIYITGGYDGCRDTSACMEYDIASNELIHVCGMPAPHKCHASIAHEGKIIVFADLALYTYKVANNAWTQQNIPVRASSAAVFRGIIHTSFFSLSADGSVVESDGDARVGCIVFVLNDTLYCIDKRIGVMRVFEDNVWVATSVRPPSPHTWIVC